MALFRGNTLSVLYRSMYHISNRKMLPATFRYIPSAIILKFSDYKNITSFAPISGIEHPKTSHMKFSHFSNSASEKPLNLDSLVHYEKVAEDTMQSLYDRFEDLLQNSKFQDWDVNYSNGVLTVTIEESSVYVINKQTPNRQIWLSSPISGPKRYDYINGIWIYKHDGISLHQLLSSELSDLLEINADFMKCNFSK